MAFNFSVEVSPTGVILKLKKSRADTSKTHSSVDYKKIDFKFANLANLSKIDFKWSLCSSSFFNILLFKFFKFTKI